MTCHIQRSGTVQDGIGCSAATSTPRPGSKSKEPNSALVISSSVSQIDQESLGAGQRLSTAKMVRAAPYPTDKQRQGKQHNGTDHPQNSTPLSVH